MTLRIREADPKDAEAIAGVHVRSWQAAYRGQLTDDYLDGLSVAERVEQHRGALEAPGEYRTWVAEEGGGIVGFAVTGPSQDADADDRTGELYAVYLEPARFGDGIGKRLSDHAIADLRERGFRTATLWVLETNAGARRFYERHGFGAVAFGDGTGNEEGVPDVLYELR